MSESAIAYQLSLIYQYIMANPPRASAIFQSVRPSQTNNVEKGTTSPTAFAKGMVRRWRCASCRASISNDNRSASREGSRRWSVVLSPSSSWRGRRTLGLVHVTTGDIKSAFDLAAGRRGAREEGDRFHPGGETHLEAHAPGWKHRRTREIWLKPDRPLPLSDRRAAL